MTVHPRLIGWGNRLAVFEQVLARARTGAPLVTTFHTSHFLKRAERPFWKPVLGRFVRGSDYALAASGEIARVAEGLAPGTRVEALLELCRTHRPRHAVIASQAHYPALRDGLRAAGLATEAHCGDEAL